MERKKPFYGSVVVLSMLILLVLAFGFPASLGIWLAAIMEGTGIELALLALIGTFFSGACFIVSMVVGKVIQKIGAKWTIFIGATAYPFFCFTSYFAHSAMTFYIASIIGGAALGFMVAP